MKTEEISFGYKIHYEGGYHFKYKFRHKIRMLIGINGSIIKNGKEYYFYTFLGKYCLYQRCEWLNNLLNKII